MPPLSALAGLDRSIELVARRLRDVTVQVLAGRASLGAGVVWQRGLVVTNAHVARTAELRVALPDGRLVAARLVARDPSRDLAALALAPAAPAAAPVAAPVPAEPGDASRLRAGALVLAVGHPLGVTGALALGVLHAAARSADDWITADIRLAPGNSGGPLADAAGRIIGINSMIVGGLGVAVPTAAVARFLEAGGLAGGKAA
jgi:serine protease Do